MLLERFLRGDGIEEELALLLVVLRAAAVAARLRHVIAPLVIELRELIELLFEFLLVRFGLRIFAFVRADLRGQLFQDRVGLHFLLDQIPQLEQRRLQNEQDSAGAAEQEPVAATGSAIDACLGRPLAGGYAANHRLRKQFPRRAAGRSATAACKKGECDLLYPSPTLPPMKRILLFAGLALATLAQANPAEPNNAAAAQVVLQAVKEVQAQQVAMAENQAKIDEKTRGGHRSHSRRAHLFEPLGQLIMP